MKKKHHLASIQKRILFITLSCILGMCLLISSVSYFIFQNYLQQSMILSTETSLQLLTDTIDESMNDIYRMVRYCQTNSDIVTYIERNPNPSSVLSVSTYDTLTEEYNRNASSNYMPRLAIISHENYLQVVNSTYSSTNDLAVEVPQLPYFETLLADSDYNFSTGLIADPFHRKGRQVLPIIRPITYQYNAKQAGYLFIEVSSELFTDPLKRYSIAEDSLVYLTMDEHTYVYHEGALTAQDISYEYVEDMSANALNRETTITKIKTANGTQIVVTSSLDMPGCYISQSISRTEQNNQLLMFAGILVATLIGILAIGILLMFIMNRMITVPVSRLQTKMLRIADGDFSRDPSIEWEHELGEIGRGINDLSENVEQLMTKRLEDEKQKRDLEYKMLQSQINPHFLYNTLNSIKWMATIQGANGISEMTTALSRLLKSISKGTSLLINIREELSLLENYFTIQSYRYGGTITMDIIVDEESLYESEIIKFTLQPLVENAIFHGIEPKGCAGKITIHVCYESQENCSAANDADDMTEAITNVTMGKRNIRIDVTDDGVGMSPEKAQQILLTNSDSSTDFFREIGVSNVHKRLQYEFGEKYGITIESVEGQFTTMSIHIPERRPDTAE